MTFSSVTLKYTDMIRSLHQSGTEPPPGHDRLQRKFRVRRFAGPVAHVDHVDHLRVVHLTDLHVGRITPLPVHFKAVEIANAARPDLVVITGDFVCHSQLYLDALTAVIHAIEAPVMCVLGNHDHWSGADEVRWALRRGGAEILDNCHTVIELRHERLQVVGVDDAYTGHSDVRRAVRGLRHDLPTLGLSHIAEEADAMWQYGVPLVLSGHTHGGQVTLARLHELAVGRVAGHRYVHGLYGSRHDIAPCEPMMSGHSRLEIYPADANSGAPPSRSEETYRARNRKSDRQTGAVYVNAGVGAAVMPIRLGERGQREVSIFELGHHPGSFDEHHQEQPALPGRKPSPRVQTKRAAAVVKKRHRRLKRVL